jgi:hypothetical protein
MGGMTRSTRRMTHCTAGASAIWITSGGTDSCCTGGATFGGLRGMSLWQKEARRSFWLSKTENRKSSWGGSPRGSGGAHTRIETCEGGWGLFGPSGRQGQVGVRAADCQRTARVLVWPVDIQGGPSESQSPRIERARALASGRDKPPWAAPMQAAAINREQKKLGKRPQNSRRNYS